MNQLSFRRADLNDPKDGEIILQLLNDFSMDSSVGQPMAEDVRKSLITNLQEFPTTRVYLAHWEGKPAGIGVCFLGFSTFKNRPILNLHDFFIKKEYRNRGKGARFLTFLEEEARRMNCGKLTLEVYHSNSRAKKLYEKMGFKGSKEERPQEMVYFLTKDIE